MHVMVMNKQNLHLNTKKGTLETQLNKKFVRLSKTCSCSNYATATNTKRMSSLTHSLTHSRECHNISQSCFQL